MIESLKNLKSYANSLILSWYKEFNFLIFTILFRVNGITKILPKISEVVENSPAYHAKLKVNDEITKIDGKEHFCGGTLIITEFNLLSIIWIILKPIINATNNASIIIIITIDRVYILLCNFGASK
jgi:hypothetical protein